MKRTNLSFFALLVFLGGLYLWNLGGYGLLEPDEARYAEIPREMLEKGDFITPTLNYVKYFEKPPLHYWCTALSMKLFGENEWGARLTPFLGGLAGVGATALFGWRFFGPFPGFLSGWILGTSFLWSVHAHLNITDMTLTFFLSLGLFAYYLGIRSNRRWLLLFYASMALAVLAKGLIGMVLPGGIILLWICWRREWKLILRSLSLPGILLFLAMVLPWFVEVWRRNPEFGWFFFVHEHFLRYTTTTHERQEPWWYFLAILPLGLLPWTGGILGGAFSDFRKSHAAVYKEGLFSYLFFWFALILLFFSLSGSKLIPYILPVFPPLALFGGLGMQALLKGETSRKGRMLFCFWPLLFALALGGYAWQEATPAPGKILPPLVLLGILPALGGILLSFGTKKRNSLSGTLLVILLGTSFLGGVKSLFPLLEPTLSGKPMAELIRQERLPEEQILCYGTYVQGLPFYLKERILLGEYEGELAFGKNQDPEGSQAWFLSKEDVRSLWQNPEKPMLLILPERDSSFWERLELKPGMFLGARDDLLLFRKIMNDSSREEKLMEENLKIRDYTARYKPAPEEVKP